MSKINVNTWEPESGTDMTMGASGDTVTVPSGVTTTGFSAAKIYSSSSAPGSPSVADVWYDTVNNLAKIWNGTAWDAMSNVFSAAGGTETTYTAIGVDYKVHTFTSSGTFTVTDASGSIDYLVLAGGAGAGGNSGGGGGAGGYRTASGFSIAIGDHTVTIGAGGAGGVNEVGGTIGGNSVLGSITSTGGGGSSARITGGVTGGSAGGSGGGGGGGVGGSAPGFAGNSGGYTPVEGYAGGAGYTGATFAGGGGGGSGAVGVDGLSGVGGAGGSSTNNSYRTGSPEARAGGGGAGAAEGNTAGAGGGGGAGAGNAATGTAPGGSATANSGSGGGGGSNGDTGGAGGSGIVIIRYIV